MFFSVSLLIVDLWRYCVRCIWAYYEVRCNPMHPLYGALPVSYVAMRVTRGALVAHRYTYEPQNLAAPKDLYLADPGTILLTLHSMVWDWRVSRAGPMLFHFPKPLDDFLSSVFFPFSSFYLYVGIVGLVSSNWYGLNQSLPDLHCRPLLLIIIIIHLRQNGGYWYRSVVFPIRGWNALGNGGYFSGPPTLETLLDGRAYETLCLLWEK